MKRTHSSPSPSSSTSVSLAAAARDASSSLSGGSSKAPTSSFGPTGHSVAKKPTDVPTSLTKSKSEVMADKEKTQKTVHTETSKRKAAEATSEKNKAKEESSKRKATEAVSGKNKVQKMTKSAAAPPAKKMKTSEVPKTKKRNVPFNKIMAKVIFVLSGYKNPERGDLREKALAMGAQYQPDWSPDSTHLICAFKNTPKFNQVKGKGKIVSKKWILDCERKRERLPTKSYRMDGGDSSTTESEEEEIKNEKSTTNKGGEDRLKPEQKKTTEMTIKPEKTSVGDDPYGGNTDTEDTPELDQKPGPSRKSTSSECDTEDELRKVREAQEADDPYGGSTEEEDNNETGNKPNVTPEAKTLNRTQSELPSLPDFFDGKHFFFYGNFDDRDQRLLNRYITAYSGTVHNYMDDEIEYVITEEDWDKNFDEVYRMEHAMERLLPDEDTKVNGDFADLKTTLLNGWLLS